MYSEKIKNLLKKIRADIGDTIELKTNNQTHRGKLMPHASESLEDIIVIKLDNGYNIGLKFDSKMQIKKTGTHEKHAKPKHEIKHDPSKPTVLILHTGGTIASKVDYEVGGVVTKFSPEDLVSMVPEIENIANIETKLVFQEWSENLTSKHWQILAKEVYKACNDKKISGIVIGHGTDTLHYTASALAFFLDNLNKPVILVGAQRSSDRGSSDAHLNLICATHLASKSDLAEVVIVMHNSASDDKCSIIRGIKARKMHSSRRDAFKSINETILGTVEKNGTIFMALENYKKRHEGKVKLMNKFEENIALVKFHPNQNPKILEYLTKSGIKGIVLEGTGLGHVYTKGKDNFIPTLEKISKKIPIFMTTQTIYGRVNMNVYNAGRMLQEGGLIGNIHDMHAELAFVKLGWVLGQTKDNKKVAKMMLTNFRGEITESTKFDAFEAY